MKMQWLGLHPYIAPNNKASLTLENVDGPRDIPHVYTCKPEYNAKDIHVYSYGSRIWHT